MKTLVLPFTKQNLFLFTSGLFSLLISISVSAHHSATPHFDASKEVIIENAEITEWRFVNPHAYLYFNVNNDQGEIEEWRCESTAATMLRRIGWSADSLKVGQIVTITGQPGRREANLCSLQTITFENGTTIDRNENYVSDTHYMQTRSAVSDKSDRPTHLENGQPNFTGSWLTLSFGLGAKGGEAPPPAQTAPNWGGYELTAAGLAIAEEYDVRFDDPALQCHPINIIEAWNHDINVNEITQTDDAVTLQYGYVDLKRIIHLNIDDHPENISPSVAGHSIGHWEGDVLVVDTIGFEPGVLLHQGGVQHTADLHVVERFYLDVETNELVREYELSDPAYFVGTHTGVDYMEITDELYAPFECEELAGANNQRPE